MVNENVDLEQLESLALAEQETDRETEERDREIRELEDRIAWDDLLSEAESHGIDMDDDFPDDSYEEQF